MSADNHAGGKQREADNCQKEDQIAGIQHPTLKTIEMRHDTERRDHIDQRRADELFEEVDHGREAGQDEKQADYH